MQKKKLRKQLNSEFKKNMKENKGNKKAQLLIIIIFIIAGAVIEFGGDFLPESIKPSSVSVNGNMEIHYLDVGQGDSIYIKVNDQDILIDAGPRSSSEELLQQLANYNIDDFEMIVATHPHEDHIGGMTAIFENYDVESFYMPKLSHTTITFEKMVQAVADEGISINVIKEGMHFDLGEGAYVDVYSPMYESYTEFNDYSPIMKFVYGDTSFIFSGDAEAHAEQEVVAKYPTNLEADVLKLGHHGSSTSSSEEFVKAVDPEYGVISCGLNNKYGHPHREIIQMLEERKIKYYRTDLQGEISFTTDGSKITVKTEK